MSDRGRADPISVTETVEPAAGTEYLPVDHDVRYVAYVQIDDEDPPERESAYETISFEVWARGKCGGAANERVRAILREQLGAENTPGTSWGRNREGDEDGIAVNVSLDTMYDRDGELLSEPTVEYETVLEVAPRAVEATIRYAEQEHTETIPVWIRTSEGQLL